MEFSLTEIGETTLDVVGEVSLFAYYATFQVTMRRRYAGWAFGCRNLGRDLGWRYKLESHQNRGGRSREREKVKNYPTQWEDKDELVKEPEQDGLGVRRGTKSA